MFGNAERVSTLRAACVDRAHALVADITDEINPNILLSANHLNKDLIMISVVEDETNTEYHEIAGANKTVPSKKILGESLGLRAAQTMSELFQNKLTVDTDKFLTQYLIEEGCEYIGKNIQEFDFIDRVDMIHHRGKFVAAPPPETVIDENMILFTFESPALSSIPRIRKLPNHQPGTDRVLILGYGYVGKAVKKTLQNSILTTTVVDQENKEGVDLIGDVTKRHTMEDLPFEDARSVVITLDDDTKAVYTMLLLNALQPDLEILCRANTREATWKLYNAGADYVLSYPEVNGEYLASLLVDNTILTSHRNFQIEGVYVETAAGKSLAELNLRQDYDCSLMAIERDQQLVTGLSGNFTLKKNDRCLLIGEEQKLKDVQTVL